MKALIAILIILSCGIVKDAESREYFSIEQYSVSPDITIKNYQAICTLFDVNGVKLKNVMVDIVEQWDDMVIIEVLTQTDINAKTHSVICK